MNIFLFLIVPAVSICCRNQSDILKRKRQNIIDMSQNTEKWPYGFPVCGSSNAHAQSTMTTDMHFVLFCLKLPQAPY